MVHLEHGVGRYVGLTTLEAGGIKAEYLILSYAGEDKLYVPVSSLHLISRYAGGADENAPLHKLGGDAWSRARQKAAEKVRDVAAELLDIYAQRAAKAGFAFKHDREQYQLFCQSFPFETTPDQEQAINAVLSDMCQPLAMDRLVCGDVGFGKTEVAMRAAFLAVENGKQVAVLVPTTLLAQQHFDNFRDRFATWPIRIEMMSRFRSAKEQQQVLDDAADGKVDIVIGTHQAATERSALERSGAADRRRRAPLRRAPQRAHQGDARRRGYPDADRNADSAHAEYGHERHARSVDYRHPRRRAAWR
ncbi:Transcription-repair-coupling factor [Serratia rubidaea]|uniref:Transcription-repair-coupling factor n=1 Tax=Serratia rubidaea TaxID=61652 RepID=A0A4U9HDJ8_SERRU|nr:Transcription-repair-coupling factor [Serratia rubidaea]